MPLDHKLVALKGAHGPALGDKLQITACPRIGGLIWGSLLNDFFEAYTVAWSIFSVFSFINYLTKINLGEILQQRYQAKWKLSTQLTL